VHRNDNGNGEKRSRQLRRDRQEEEGDQTWTGGGFMAAKVAWIMRPRYCRSRGELRLGYCSNGCGGDIHCRSLHSLYVLGGRLPMQQILYKNGVGV
jgi:hypothetical protein